jgi:hypothetical protein
MQIQDVNIQSKEDENQKQKEVIKDTQPYNKINVLKHSYDVCKYEAKNFRKKAKTNKRRKNDN